MWRHKESQAVRRRITVAHGISRHRHLHTLMCPPRDLDGTTLLRFFKKPISLFHAEGFELTNYGRYLGRKSVSRTPDESIAPLFRGQFLFYAHFTLYDTLWVYGWPSILIFNPGPSRQDVRIVHRTVATLIVKITLNVKIFTLRVNNPPLM